MGKTPQFWMSYMDHISLVLQLMRSVKSNDFQLYAFCISKMPDLFFSYGAQNYARYTTFFTTFLSNLEFSHPGASEEVKLGVISVARSFIPGNRCAVDKTMEETFMKHSKSKGGAGGVGAGICGLNKNYSATQRWVRTTHERSKYLELTNMLADLNGGGIDMEKHKDLRPTEIIKSELAVKVTIDAIENFVNPFTISDKEHLYSLSSGLKIPQDIEQDLLKAENCRQ